MHKDALTVPDKAEEAAAVSEEAVLTRSEADALPEAENNLPPAASGDSKAKNAAGSDSAKSGTDGGSGLLPEMGEKLKGDLIDRVMEAGSNGALSITYKLHVKPWQLPIALACIILGLMVSLQYKAQQNTDAAIKLEDRRETLAMVRTLEAERNKLSTEITDLRTRIAGLEEASGRNDALSKQIQEQLGRSRVEAGLTGMKGPGVSVVLSDSPRSAPANTDPYFYIVHDVDLQALVNELWASGAEAVCINNQRVVTRTSIRCVGPTILVNGVRMAAPYTVKGIGPGDLETALRMPGGFLDSMSALINNGGQVTITRMDSITIPPFEGSLVFRYSQAVEVDKKE
ncbi:DUF881 domain-containing protein [bacterium]|nr:DUF881 domain-containing protein [bacterium]